MWIDAIKDGYGSSKHKMLTSSFDYAGPMTETVLMGNIAIRSYLLNKGNGNPDSVRITGKGRNSYYRRKKLSWDGENMKITTDDANQFVGENYREGWQL